MTVFWFMNNFPLNYNIDFYDRDTLDYSNPIVYKIKRQSIFNSFEKPKGFDEFLAKYGDFWVIDTELHGDNLRLHISEDCNKNLHESIAKC